MKKVESKEKLTDVMIQKLEAKIGGGHPDLQELVSACFHLSRPGWRDKVPRHEGMKSEAEVQEEARRAVTKSKAMGEYRKLIRKFLDDNGYVL